MRKRPESQEPTELDPEAVKAAKKKVDEAKKKVEEAQGKLRDELFELKRTKRPRRNLIILISFLFLITPGGVIPSLVLGGVTDAVPTDYGWLIRILLLIAWVISCALVYMFFRSGRIARKKEEVTECREELARRQTHLKEVSPPEASLRD
jgi:hypothetical protein